MKLKILTTGGTIDKIYFDASSRFEVGEPQISHILDESGVAFEYGIRQLMRKDSLEMTPEDRLRIREAIETDDCERFLVTHGTDTMVDTAAALRELPGKTIVLTGALQPARFRSSDAIFNIGLAVGATQTMPPGVYVAMNGRIFAADRVRKNKALNRFEPLNGNEEKPR